MITYRASLDVPEQTLVCVSRWLAAHRKAHDVRPWQRAATSFTQAVLVLRWFKDATDLRVLARDAKVSIATAYRYLHEAIDVIAEHVPELVDVLAHGSQQGGSSCAWTERSSRPCARAGNPRPGTTCGNPASTTGTAATCRCSPTRTVIPNGSAPPSPARPTTSPPPASTPFPRYIGAGIGVLVPIKGSNLAPDNRARNTLITPLRAPAERANARPVPTLGLKRARAA